MNFSPIFNSATSGPFTGGRAPSPELSKKALQNVLQMLHDRIRISNPNADHDSMSLNHQHQVFLNAGTLGRKTAEKASQLSRGLRLCEVREKRESAERDVEDFEEKYGAAVGKLERLEKEEEAVRAKLREGSPFFVVDENTRAVRGMGFNETCFGDGEVTDSDVEGRGGDEGDHDDLKEDVEMDVASLED
ncbi:hypothetical protein QSH57_004384 [Fusarium oxysporum f. sp. vasinfectum]|nr:hypothetical protein QSH57_004384 [Fusarium oxysporum f. sp. vasinfectum]